MNAKLIVPVLLILAAGSASAARFDTPENGLMAEDRFTRTVNLDPDGWLRVENPNGKVVIIGNSDGPHVIVEAKRTVRAVDEDALKEGMSMTRVAFGGDGQKRLIRTEGFFARTGLWTSSIDYTLRVPRTANIGVHTFHGEMVRISGLAGELYVTAANGRVELIGNSGPAEIETVNASILADYRAAPRGEVKLSSVYGDVELRLPSGMAHRWDAESVGGEIFSSLASRSEFVPVQGKRVHRVTPPGIRDVLFHAGTIGGRVFVIENGRNREQARKVTPPQGTSLRLAGSQAKPQPLRDDIRPVLQRMSRGVLLRPPSASAFVAQWGRIDGNFQVESSLGNIFVGDVRGDVLLNVQAGEIVLGSVVGRTEVKSGGGPVNLGDLHGQIRVVTGAGDVLLRRARSGGFISTEGGDIQVEHAGGGVTLRSGGGDLVVRKLSAGPADLVTRSGDILLTIDPQLKSTLIGARTEGGNIVLTLPPDFRADIEAVVVTTPNEANAIESAFQGLSILREREGSKVRIRAVGKINGGGSRVYLMVENGHIQIRSH